MCGVSVTLGSFSKGQSAGTGSIPKVSSMAPRKPGKCNCAAAIRLAAITVYNAPCVRAGTARSLALPNGGESPPRAPLSGFSPR